METIAMRIPLWSAADTRLTWERWIFKLSLVGTVIWYVLGTPTGLRSASYEPLRSTSMSFSTDSDWDPNPERQFAKRREQNAQARQRDNDSYQSTLMACLGFPLPIGMRWERYFSLPTL
jgi:hypothetical protein